MAKFLDNLTDVLGQQLNIGENKLSTLDTKNKDGTINRNGRLGEFAKQIDNSAQRSYLEGGYHRNDLFNPKVNQLNILYQEPDYTVLIKKRAFSSLAENYRNDAIGNEERLFVRATKFLFQNKAKQISAYEKLSKIAQITNKTGTIDDALLPTIFAATDVLSGVPELGGTGSSFSKFQGVVNRVRTLYNLSDDALSTTWITNNDNSFTTSLGEGTGVIELTTATSISTTASIKLGAGQASLTFVDPLQLMRITNNDIEQAIADATNAVLGSSFVQLGNDLLQTTIDQAKKNLNQIRADRRANPIIFTVNSNTYLGRRIIAMTDFSGIDIKFEGNMLDINIDNDYVVATGRVGNDALLGEEPSLFRLIIRSLYNQLQINKNSQTTQRAHNKSTSGLRKKLRLHYGTEMLIQPMDVVHIYASSKTRKDNKVLGGLTEPISGVGFLQSINKNLMNVEDFFDAGRDESIEKAIFVGSDFPNWLWLLMRNQFTASKSGTHIFAGVVSENTHSFNGGKYELSVSCKDNSHYFDLGMVNYKPSLNVFNGSLYDPLTPFDVKFDSITGMKPDAPPVLLPENIALFEKSVFAKYKNGVYVGKKPSLNNFISDSERIKNNENRRVFYDPDGMVYKWKEGIGALVMFGSTFDSTSPSQTGNASITADPFAGQDVMNVLSLLITGEPYNYATFYNAATSNSDFGRNPQTNEDPANAYFRNLQKDLKARNTMYGNFIPFKSISMDQDSYIKAATGQIRANQADQELNQLLADRAALQDSLVGPSNGGGTVGASTAVLANDIKSKIDQVNKKITDKMNNAVTAIKNIDPSVSVVGNQINFDSSKFGNSNKNDQSNQATAAVRLKKKLNYLTRRLAWKVRNNEDVNYFIVDDTYDKDYDIQAFEKHFANAELFRSDYISVKDQIERVAKLLDLEVFADTQGHIQIRPPQYNKVPTSVFYRMMRLKQEYDIQLFPEYLEDLFVNQITSALKQVEIIEDELRLYCAALGYNSDTKAVGFLNQKIPNMLSGILFTFISPESTGVINVPSLATNSEGAPTDLASVDDPERQLSKFSKKLDALTPIETQAQITNLFSTVSVSRLPFSITSPETTIGNTLRQKYIIDRLNTKTGVEFDMSQVFSGAKNYLTGKHISAVELLKAYTEIGTKLATRQRLLKVALSAIQNAKAGAALMQNKGGSADKLFSAGLVNNSQIPQAMQYMLEDEGYDDYGPGSGKRYIIKNEHIKSFNISSTSPSITSISVTGTFADNFDVSLPQELNGFSGGGNALTTAEAVDYDLWRKYGVRQTQNIAAPFLSDPQTQCAPFAVALLNKARNEIHNGTLIIIGNEYMQPGEVIYLEDQDKLYYVDSVQHTIQMGQSFTTQLSLSAGHMMGEYIPTYLDVVGKALYKNKDITNYVNKKQGNVNSEEYLGAFLGGMDGPYSAQNKKMFDIVLSAASNALLSPSAKLEFRTYHANKHNMPGPLTSTINLAESIRDLMVGETSLKDVGKSLSGQDKPLLADFAKSGQIPLPAEIAVDADADGEGRSPSPAAYSLARSFSNNSDDITKIEDIIYKFVVDVVVTFNPIT